MVLYVIVGRDLAAITFALRDTVMVFDLKLMLTEFYDVDPENMVLHFDGSTLDDNFEYLEEYGVSKKAFLHSIMLLTFLYDDGVSTEAEEPASIAVEHWDDTDNMDEYDAEYSLIVTPSEIYPWERNWGSGPWQELENEMLNYYLYSDNSSAERSSTSNICLPVRYSENSLSDRSSTSNICIPVRYDDSFEQDFDEDADEEVVAVHDLS